jgi:AraC family transcriptional regulator of adaptative response / DNA-3-methyladenine glycosylase II
VQLDYETCEQARLNYDARYDGRVFIGNMVSGVYCRPVCPTPHSKRANVRYFPTAAAAAEAGFRPCMRCRPEAAPGTPAWGGTSSTVSRGLRLIAEGALDEAGVARLADRLGVTSRHLDRLFRRHLGASPTSIARTRRLHLAKQLISETNLPMAQVALAAGFGSIRRFNDVLRRSYGCPPSDLRRPGRRPNAADDEYVFQLAYRPPYAWNALLSFLAPRCIPGVESVRDGTYRRTILLRDSPGVLEVAQRPWAHALRVRLRFHRPEHILQAVARVRSMFDVTAIPQLVQQDLGKDRLLAPLLRRQPGLRLPGAWDPFEIIVYAILGQWMAPSEAVVLLGRLAERHGQRLTLPGAGGLSRIFPPATALAAADLAGISAIPTAAVRMIRTAARLLRPIGPANPPEELISRLESIAGLEESSLQLIALRALNDPDALPCADRSVVAGYAATGSGTELATHSESWKPWRGYAAMYLMCAREDLLSVPENSRDDSRPQRLIQRRRGGCAAAPKERGR